MLLRVRGLDALYSVSVTQELDLQTTELRPETSAIREQLSRMLAARGFVNSARMRDFLTFIVENALAGEAPVKETVIGVQVFRRSLGYDSNLEPIVRVEARRLRAKLEEYYEGDGADDPVLITLPKGGYTPEFSWRPSSEPAAAEVPPAPLASPPVARPRKWVVWATAGAVCAVLAVSAFLSRFVARGQPQTHSVAASSIRSIAVLPLTNLSGDPADEYLAEGITDELIGTLANISTLRVISQTSTMVYQKARKPLPEIAKELNVDAIVQGTVTRSNREVRIAAHLVQARQDRVLWSQEYTRPSRDLLALEDEVARAIAKQVRFTAGGGSEMRPSAPADVSPEAWDAYLKGRYFWNKRTEQGLRKSIGYLRDSVRQAPDFARGWAELADSWLLLGELWLRPNTEAFAEANAAVNKALALDDTLGQAHACKAALEADQGRWDLAEPEFRRALELSPNYATAHQWYAENLADHGRTTEALYEIERARELDPLSLAINVQIGGILYGARQYDKATAQLRAAIEMDPFFWLAHANLAAVYEAKGMYREAAEEFQKAVDLTQRSPRVRLLLARAWALEGRQAQAREAQPEFEKRFRGDADEASSLALLDVALGEPDRALAEIRAACSAHRDPGFNRTPFYDPLWANASIAAAMNSCRNQ